MSVHTLLVFCVCMLYVKDSDNFEDIPDDRSNFHPASKLIFSAERPPPVTSALPTRVQDDILDRLNEGRRDVVPAATNMMRVEWDDDLANAAANVLDTCFFSVSMPEKIDLLIDKSVIQATGITKNFSFYLPEAMSFWLDLGKDVYVYDSFDCQAKDKIICKMYKLLTWSTMYKVGCSQRFCPVLFDSFSSNTEENYIYWKCNYANIGRFWDDGFSYSSGGEACSECPSGKGWCNRGLCDDSCSTADSNCYCALETSCSSNGQFSEEECSCSCDAGYIGNSCQMNIYSTSTSNASRSLIAGPYYGSSTPLASLVLATSTQVPAHPTVVGAFLANKSVFRREERDVDMWTMDSSTYVMDQSTDTDVTTDFIASTIETSTDEPAEELTDETATGGGSTLGASTTDWYDETTVDISTIAASTTYTPEETTEQASTFGFSTTDVYDETTSSVSTLEVSTVEADDETTVDQSTLAVSTDDYYEETTVDQSTPETSTEDYLEETPFISTFGSTPAQTSTAYYEETTEEELTEPIVAPFDLDVGTTDGVTIVPTTDAVTFFCSLSCGGGGRLDADTCTCVCDVEGFTYNYTEAACQVCDYEVPCNGSGILDVDTCTCYCASGYQGPACEETCNVTTPGCWEDYSDPGDELSDDYCPVYCPYCDDCSGQTCANGGYADKIAGFEADRGMCRCYCPLPWSGLDCDECNLTCLNGGTLNSTDCSCQCLPGSSGIDCSRTCKQTSLLCTKNASLRCDLPLIAKSCPIMCGTCDDS